MVLESALAAQKPQMRAGGSKLPFESGTFELKQKSQQAEG
jgi:hypothetical protein